MCQGSLPDNETDAAFFGAKTPDVLTTADDSQCQIYGWIRGVGQSHFALPARFSSNKDPTGATARETIRIESLELY